MKSDKVKVIAFFEKMKEIWNDDDLSPQDKEELTIKYLEKYEKEIQLQKEAKNDEVRP